MTEQMTWQPIETAPKDGTWILGYTAREHQPHHEHGPYLTQWAWAGDVVPKDVNGDPAEDYDDDFYGWWEESLGWLESALSPTHWMPLPNPPKETGQ